MKIKTMEIEVEVTKKEGELLYILPKALPFVITDHDVRPLMPNN